MIFIQKYHERGFEKTNNNNNNRNKHLYTEIRHIYRSHLFTNSISLNKVLQEELNVHFCLLSIIPKPLYIL